MMYQQLNFGGEDREIFMVSERGREIFCPRGEKETWRAFAIGEVGEDQRRSETDSDWVFRLLY